MPTVNIGSTANDGTGDSLRVGGGKINDAIQAIVNNNIPVGTIIESMLADEAVTNAKLADMAQSTFKLRADGAGTGAPIDGTATQARTILGLTGTLYAGIFATIAAALAYPGIGALNTIETRGHTTEGDGGGAVYRRVASNPAHELKIVSGANYFEIAEFEIHPQHGGAFGVSGSEETTAFQRAVTAAGDLGRTLRIVTPPAYWVLGEIVMDYPGLHVVGDNAEQAYIYPATDNQRSIFRITENAPNCDISVVTGSGIYRLANPLQAFIEVNAGRCEVSEIYTSYQQKGLWMRKGGSQRIRDAHISRPSVAGIHTGGAGVKVDQSVFERIEIDGAITDGANPADWIGKSLWIDSWSSSHNWVDCTFAGQDTGVTIEDATTPDANPLLSRPEGIWFWNLNLDLTRRQVLVVNTGSRIEFFGGDIRSRDEEAIALNAFQGVKFYGTKIGQSGKDGIVLWGTGTCTDLRLHDCTIWANGVLATSGRQYGIRLAGSSCDVVISGGQITNRSLYGAAGSQTHALRIDTAFSGTVVLNAGVDVSGNATDAFSFEATGDRAKLTATDVNGAKSRNSASTSFTLSGTSSTLIPHGLFGTPTNVQLNVRTVARFAYFLTADATNIQVAITDSAGTGITTGTFTVDWTAAL